MRLLLREYKIYYLLSYVQVYHDDDEWRQFTYVLKEEREKTQCGRDKVQNEGRMTKGRCVYGMAAWRIAYTVAGRSTVES